MTHVDRTLSRDCAATLIPAGSPFTLPKGTHVMLTHNLGGNYTVTCDYGMFRIDGRDADALGEAKQTIQPVAGAAGTVLGLPEESLFWDKLRTVYDPEIPVNIVDLGLVYSLDVMESEDKKGCLVHVYMTLTAPGCGMGPVIAEDARCRLVEVPGVTDAVVEIVWDPPWDQSRMSEPARLELGFF